MPQASLRPCRNPKCATLVAYGYCPDCKPPVSSSPRLNSTQRGYNSRWQKARKTFLSRAENALCRICKESKRLTPASVVDHKTPHRGSQALFWDTSNWQPLCTLCHNAKSAKELHDIINTRAQKKCDT